MSREAVDQGFVKHRLCGTAITLRRLSLVAGEDPTLQPFCGKCNRRLHHTELDKAGPFSVVIP